MEISNIITILLFVLPGILSERISCKIEYPSKIDTSNFKETINGVYLSFPIILIGAMILYFRFDIVTFEMLITGLDDMLFLFKFIIIIFITSILMGVIKGIGKGKIRKLINVFRSKWDKMPIDDRTCWEIFLLDQKEHQFLEVIKNGDSYKGFIKYNSILNNETEIILKIHDVLYSYPDFNIDELFTDVVGIYINPEKDVVIKDYDMSKYYEWVNTKSEKGKATSEF